MRKQQRMVTFTAGLCMAVAQWLAAASGTWTGGSGNWSDKHNWFGGVIANGADASATFNNAGAIAATVDTARTIGRINKASGTGAVHIVGSALLTLQDSSGATLDAAAGEICVGVPLGGQAFAKSGAGLVVLTSNAVHSMAGMIRVDGGELRLDSAGHTLPAITQVYVAASNAAARLHYTSAEDGLSVYPCAFRISGQNGLGNGMLAGYGPLCVYADKLEAAVSNIVLNTNFGDVARIGQQGAGGKLEFRGEVTGAAGLELYVNGEKTNEFYGSNSYAGAMYVTLANGSSRLVMNMRGSHRLPYTTLAADLGGGGECVMDLNGHEQKTLNTEIKRGTLYLQSTGATGTWLVGSRYPSEWDMELSENSQCVIGGGAALAVAGNVYSDIDCKLVVTNGGYLYCGEELWSWEQHWDFEKAITIADGGRARVRVMGSDFGDLGIVDIVTGGRLEMAVARHNQVGVEGLNGFRIDGGTLADWADDNYGGIGNDEWIMTDVDIHLGLDGATFDIQHPNGRTILSQISHENDYWNPGFWGIVKTGPGDLNLAYDANFIMHVIVSNGTLRVMDRVYGEDVVVHGGAIGGTGSLPETLIASGGAIAPGKGVGALTIRNALTLQSGSIYEWEKGVGVDNADKIAIWDGLEIGNAVTVKVVRLPGALPDGYGVTNTIIEAGGTISGFGNLELDLSGVPGWTGRLVHQGQKIGIVLIPEPAEAAGVIWLGWWLAYRRGRRDHTRG